MNLSTAQATKRSKEVGVRKSVGAGRQQLSLQFFGESLLLAFVSFPIAWTIVELVQPAWNGFIGHTTELDMMNRPEVFLGPPTGRRRPEL